MEYLHDIPGAARDIIVRLVRINYGKTICFARLIHRASEIRTLIGNLQTKGQKRLDNTHDITYFVEISRWIHCNACAPSIKLIAIEI